MRKSKSTARGSYPGGAYPKVFAILLAAGESTRFAKKKNGQNKLLMPLVGKPVWYHSLQALHDHPEIDSVVLVTSKKLIKKIQTGIRTYHFPKVKAVIEGGKTRQQSFGHGFIKMRTLLPDVSAQDIVVVHNSANPLVSAAEISATIRATRKYGAAAVGKEIVDTVKEIQGKTYKKTIDREKLRAAQTPQAARYGIFMKALLAAEKQQKVFTDETSLVENLGVKVHHVPASESNFKITIREDYLHARAILGDFSENFLVGIGQDSHEFSDSEKGLTLGGIRLEHEQKLAADSDGDVILHALCNGILQALGKGSLGTIATPLFREKNICDSKIYLARVLALMQKTGYHLNNIGIMLEGKKPPFDPIAGHIKTSLSVLAGVAADRIGITATTGKNLSSFGHGKGIQCFAIVSLLKNPLQL